MNWSEFFSMGGYAFYVWGSYLATLILMGGEVVLLRRRRKVTHQQTPSGSGVQGKVVTNETTS
jgi:heme exporter protein D